MFELVKFSSAFNFKKIQKCKHHCLPFLAFSGPCIDCDTRQYIKGATALSALFGQVGLPRYRILLYNNSAIGLLFPLTVGGHIRVAKRTEQPPSRREAGFYVAWKGTIGSKVVGSSSVKKDSRLVVGNSQPDQEMDICKKSEPDWTETD